MKKSLITLPSERYEMYEKQLAEKDAELFAARKLADEKDAELFEKDALIAELQRQLAEATKTK